MKIFDEIKKQYYTHITIYNEIAINKYSLEDIVLIYDNLIKRFNELYLSRELIKMNLSDIQNKTDKGVLGQTFIMDLNGKSDRINVDYSILVKILESIIGIHISLSEKYKNMAQTIADQVNYNEETSEILSAASNTTRKNDDAELFFSKNE
jgi:hypothetical protein